MEKASKSSKQIQSPQKMVLTLTGTSSASAAIPATNDPGVESGSKEKLDAGVPSWAVDCLLEANQLPPEQFKSAFEATARLLGQQTEDREFFKYCLAACGPPLPEDPDDVPR